MMRRLLFILVLTSCWNLSGQIRLVQDLIPGSDGSNPNEFLEHNNLLFFWAGSATGTTLYAMDEDENISFVWGNSGTSFGMVVYNNELYFTSNGQLHRLNQPYGTGSTLLLPTLSIFGSAFVFNGELYLGGELNQADPLNPNYELMAYNGTTFRLVEEESSISLNPNQFTQHVGELYFIGNDTALINATPTTVNKLYKTDGIQIDAVPFWPNASVSYLTSLDDDLFYLFRNGDITQPYNLGITNSSGTAGFGDPLSFAFGLTVFDNKLFFYDEGNTALKSRDVFGVEATIPIASGLEYPFGSFPLQNDKFLAFSGFTNALGTELYIYEADGEIQFTLDYNTGTNSFSPVYGSFFNNKLYLSGDDGTGIGRELHIYDTNCPETVQIPDPNFEAYLENELNVGDGILGNGLVCKGQVETITNLNISNQNINDLSGLETFAALQILNVSNNNLNALELQNPNLIEIYANDCNLEGKSIRFQNTPPNGAFLTNVTILELQNNRIGTLGSTISFGGVPNVTYLDISDNGFGTIQLNESTSIQTLLASNCTNLTTLANLNLLNNLESLGVSFSRLSALNVDQNVQLSFMNVSGNNLTSLDLSSNPLMASVYASDNNLSTIVLPNTTTLSELYAENNVLTALDISITDQNLSDLDATGNPNLTCIQVSNLDFAQRAWQIDAGTGYSTNCNPQPFVVNALLAGDVVVDNTLACCPTYEIQEGQRLDINFNADPNAPLAEAYIVRAAFSGDADANDFSVRESSANQEYTYTVKTTDPDNILQIDILNENDGITEADELLQITLIPVGTNFTLADPQVFEVTIKPVNSPAPFEVTANIQGATGTSPNFEITEGNSFTLNFESNATAIDGTQYAPIIQFTLNGNSTTEDFTFNGNTPLPTTPFTVITNNPDGTITIVAVNDGNVEPDETYTITLSSPDQSLFIMAGETSFEVMVKDRQVTSNEPLAITTSIEGLGGGPYYSVNEGDTFDLIINTDNSSAVGLVYELDISYQIFTIGPAVNEFGNEDFIANERTLKNSRELNPAPERFELNNETFAVNSNGQDGSITFEILDDNINEEMEELIIIVKATNEIHTVTTERFVIKIAENDPIPVGVSIIDAGLLGNYNVTEGETFRLVGNIIGSTQESFELVLWDESTTAVVNEDFYFSNPKSFSLETNFNDFDISFTTYLDAVIEDTETITIKLPKPSGNYIWQDGNNEGELEFQINILDRPLTISANISDTATLANDGVYEISEGEKFELMFSYDFEVPNFNLTPIPVQINFTSTNQQDNTDIIKPLFDGTINRFNRELSYDVVLDGIVDPGDTFSISLPAPSGNYTYSNAPDGDLTFNFRILDVPFEDNPNNHNFEIFAKSGFNDGFTDTSNERRVLDENGVYRIRDNETLFIRFESENENFELSKGIRINALDGTAFLGTDYRSGDNSLNQELIGGTLPEILISLTQLEENESSKTFELEIIPTTNNYSLTDQNNNIITYLNGFIIPFEIIPNENTSSQRKPQEILVNVTGAEEVVNDNDAIVESYNLTEGNTFVIELASKKPNNNQGQVYDLQFLIDEASTLSENDYTITIEDGSGRDLNGSLSNYTVDNTRPFNARITIELLEDGELETPEILKLNIIPEAEFIENQFENTVWTSFVGSSGADQREFSLNVSDQGNPQRIVAYLRNTGGTEGYLEPDVITCYLRDEENNPYTAHTDRIEIPYLFLEDEDLTVTLFENEFNPFPTQKIFVFEPGQSEASIEVLYQAEEDENNTDCDYYSLKLQESNSTQSNDILVDTNDYDIKIADNKQFLVFVDLDISNNKIIRPVIRNRHPEDNYESGFSDNDLNQEITGYEIEEGPESILFFSIDAAKPVAEGTEYFLNVVPDHSSSNAAKRNSEFTFRDGNRIKSKISVLKDQIDEIIEIKIETDDDFEEEILRLDFKRPKEKKDFQFTKKESRNYDRFYEIKILEALPVSVKKSVREISENADVNDFGEFIFTVDRSNENSFASKTIKLRFELNDVKSSPSDPDRAQYFSETPDYSIQTANQIFFNQATKSGIITIGPDQTEVKLKIIPNNDTDDENDEIIRLKIIDDFGYRPSATEGEDSIIIIDDDESAYTITFENEIGPLSESRDGTFSDILTIGLDRINETGQPIAVGLTVDSAAENAAVFNEDYELFIVNADDSRTQITSIANLELVLPNGQQTARLEVVVREDTDYEEDDETLRIQISTSAVYGPGELTSQSIPILNQKEDGTSNITLFAEVISSSCEEEKNGRILVTNRSEYTFKALLYKGDMIEDTKELPPSTDENSSSYTFPGLEVGNYTVYLIYEGSQSLPKDFVPPSFELTIREPTDAILLNSIVDKNFRVAKLTLSGSKRYDIWRNDELFSFKTETTAPTDLEIPMMYGRNVFEIKGEKDCQDTMLTTLYLDTAQSYPNPTTAMVYVAGFFNMDTVTARVTELTGRTVINTQKLNIDNGVLGVDLSSLSPGVYLLHLETPNQTTVDLKIVKQ